MWAELNLGLHIICFSKQWLIQLYWPQVNHLIHSLQALLLILFIQQTFVRHLSLQGPRTLLETSHVLSVTGPRGRVGTPYLRMKLKLSESPVLSE